MRGAALVFLAVASCGSCDTAPAPVRDAGLPASASAPVPIPTTTSSVGPWAAASGGDELATLRLAELHTAPELLAIARGGPQADVALRALTRSEDAELVLAGLVELARGARGERALETLVAIAARPPRSTEPLDPDALRACIDGLDALSRDENAPRSRRVLAVNALRGFARAGYLDARRITTALD